MYTSHGRLAGYDGFNRYIVECKSVQSIVGADEYTI